MLRAPPGVASMLLPFHWRRDDCDVQRVAADRASDALTVPHSRMRKRRGTTLSAPKYDRALRHLLEPNVIVLRLRDVTVTTQMRWIRRNRRVGAWAALFALAVQITLSFSHVHLDKNVLSSLASAHTAQLQSAERRSPSGSGHHQNAADFCDICATIALVASSLLPQTAVLTPPLATPRAWMRPLEAASSSRQAPNHFQARAPPFVV